MNERNYYVYIMVNRSRTVLYVGVTNDIARRVGEHRSGVAGGFTKRYRMTSVVHIEVFSSVYEAISREKQLKAGPRKRKMNLIDEGNPQWLDLSETL